MMASDDLVVNRSLRIPRVEIVERFGTSGGPGGQHANKVETRVELAFDAAKSQILTDSQRARIIDRHGPVVRVSVDDTRSQARNREIAAQRLAERIAGVLVTSKQRRATRPTRASQRRRLSAKRRRSDLKSSRRKPRVGE